MWRRGVTGFLIGGATGALSAGLTFMILATLDNTRFDEALVYSVFVAFIGGTLGAIGGALIGLGNMRWTGGALVGLVMSLLVVAVYITSYAPEGTLLQQFNRSRIIIIVLTLPLVLAGIVTAVAGRALDVRR